MKPIRETILLAIAVVVGSLTGLYTPFEIALVDFFIIAMLFFLFYNISLGGIFRGIKNRKYLTIALVSNFVVIPLIAYLLSATLIDATSAIFVGLIIYLVAPCTDWYLGFTKLAGGDVEVNSALLPFNLLGQILLLPVYLYLFTANTISIPYEAFFDVLIYWVFLPFALAQLLRFLVSKIRADVLEKSSSLAESLGLVALILLVFSIFNSNIESLMANTDVLPRILAVILIFFIGTFFLARFTSKWASFQREERVSLTMTTAARNAPLMLAISLIFFPEEPMIHSVLVLGMLVEFPHLITISYILKK